VKPVFLVGIIGLVLGASWDGLCLWDLAHADQVRYLPAGPGDPSGPSRLLWTSSGLLTVSTTLRRG
jgi:hypothetical protein